jgi:hypothetical protein
MEKKATATLAARNATLSKQLRDSIASVRNPRPLPIALGERSLFESGTDPD